MMRWNPQHWHPWGPEAFLLAVAGIAIIALRITYAGG